MICAGIDAGSRTIKVVLLDARSLEVRAAGVTDQGVEQDTLALRLLEGLLHENAIRRGDIRSTVATGYGRKLIPFADAMVTEITCQAWGVRHRVPDARTIIDIGGQDSKLLRLNPEGRVADFVMNDRCAAGTGRFLEVVATRLGVKLPRLGEMAANWLCGACADAVPADHYPGGSGQRPAASDEHSALSIQHSAFTRSPATISSMCVVFAETEITGLLASGRAAAEIAAGVQAAIATRMAAMAGSDPTLPVLFTGGVALVPGMAAALESALRKPVGIAPDPQMTCALGAAILAARRLEKG